MKLHNKKTGEIGVINLKIYGDDAEYVYDTIETLFKEWEDYTPPKPLIKDEKIRKAVRAWAEANDIERVWHECASCWLRGNGLSIEMENEVDELEQGNYTITELCGEEEE